MSLLSDLINLELPGTKIIAEYIWIGGSGVDLKSKARTLPGPVTDPAKLPKLNYDGFSTDQVPGDDSEVILYPQAIFKDPFRGGNHILVICDTYTPAGYPLPTNKRFDAVKVFSHPDVVAEEPWYGFNQECTLLPVDENWPLGAFPVLQGPRAAGDIADAFHKACLYAGINLSGINGEVVPGKWEFHPSVGISAGDQVLAARYILERIAEIAGVVVSFDPKPLPGDWSGPRARTSYSTKSMRGEGGYEAINKAIEKLRLRHTVHIEAYGTAGDTTPFSSSVVNCGSVIKDRRAAANMDPYVITSMIAETTILWKPSLLEKLKSVARKCICNN